MEHLSPAGAEAWARKDFLPSGDDLPDWLRSLGEQHRAAVEELEKSVGAVVGGRESVEASARAWRRAVRDAVAQGAEPPARTFDPDVVAATVAVGEEDVAFARDALASLSVAILDQLRTRRDEFEPYIAGACPELRKAASAFAEGDPAAVRAAVKATVEQLDAEPAIVDLTRADHQQFVGEGEETHAIA
jgi:hypothetical protein